MSATYKHAHFCQSQRNEDTGSTTNPKPPIVPIYDNKNFKMPDRPV